MKAVPEKAVGPRKLIWLVDSLDRVVRFPPAVRHKPGFALDQAQIGQQHESAKILHGLAETVWQVRADVPGGTPRRELDSLHAGWPGSEATGDAQSGI